MTNPATEIEQVIRVGLFAAVSKQSTALQWHRVRLKRLATEHCVGRNTVCGKYQKSCNFRQF